MLVGTTLEQATRNRKRSLEYGKLQHNESIQDTVCKRVGLSYVVRLGLRAGSHTLHIRIM